MKTILASPSPSRASFILQSSVYSSVSHTEFDGNIDVFRLDCTVTYRTLLTVVQYKLCTCYSAFLVKCFEMARPLRVVFTRSLNH